LCGSKNFVSKRNMLSIHSVTLSQWRDPENGSDMSGSGSLTTACARVLNLLELINLNIWKVVIERMIVVKFKIDSRSCSCTGCFEIEMWMDTASFL